MTVILLSLIVCVIAIIVLLNAKPNLLIFNLREIFLLKMILERSSLLRSGPEHKVGEGGDIINVTKP